MGEDVDEPFDDKMTRSALWREIKPEQQIQKRKNAIGGVSILHNNGA